MILPDEWRVGDEPEVVAPWRDPVVWLVVPGGGLRGMIGGTLVAEVWKAIGDSLRAKELGIPELAWFTHDDVMGAGDSIGALIMARLSEGELPRVPDDFRSVKRRSQILHIPLDIRRGIIGDGLVSMRRARKHMLRRGVGCRPRTIPAWAGVIDAATGDRWMLPVDGRVDRQRAEDRWMCSGSQSPGMEIISCHYDGAERVAYDDGWLRTCPDLPGVQEGDLVVVGWNSPIEEAARHVPRSQRELRRARPHFDAQLETHVTRNVLEHDLPYLRRLASAGVEVRMFAPAHIAESAPTFDISPELNASRHAAALRALQRGPIFLEAP